MTLTPEAVGALRLADMLTMRELRRLAKRYRSLAMLGQALAAEIHAELDYLDLDDAERWKADQ